MDAELDRLAGVIERGSIHGEQRRTAPNRQQPRLGSAGQPGTHGLVGDPGLEAAAAEELVEAGFFQLGRVCPENPVDWTHAVVALVRHHPVLIFAIVGLFALKQLFVVLKRLPGLIAAFCLAITNDGKKAEQAAKALEVLEPRWHWIWQKRG